MDLNSTIYVAGSTGLVGSALMNELENSGYTNVVGSSTVNFDLRDREATHRFFDQHRPEYVFVASAKVGGIVANRDQPVDFLSDNLLIAQNVISSAHEYGVRKLLFLGSSCIYPKQCAQPMREDSLLSGPLEPTNEAYALAKIAGIKLCQAYRDQHDCDFISALPTNLYGRNDHYHPENSHVIPGMLRKFHEAKEAGKTQVELWGTGTPKREFMHADDLATACIHLMLNYSYREPINVGTGEEFSIAELAESVRSTVGFQGDIIWNSEMPDGTPRKLLDCSKLSALGFKHQIHLAEGLRSTYLDMKKQLRPA